MNIMEHRGLDHQDDLATGSVVADREGADEKPPFVVQYLTIVRRRKWVIIGSLIGSLLLGIVVTLLMTPNYTAEATLEIQREQRNFTLVKGAQEAETGPTDIEFYQTQYGLLRARSLADRVATDLRLHDNPQFFEMFGATTALDWFSGQTVKPDAPPREARIRVAGDILLDNFEVVPERLSRLVEIKFTSPEPEFSQRVVDAWGNHFIQSQLERRFEATSYARHFLEERLTQLRTRIDASERQLVDYAAQQGIINLPVGASGESGGGERSLLAEDLTALNRELSTAIADRVEAQRRLSSRGDTVTEALQNTAISQMRELRAQREAEYARLMVQFEPEYPPARALAQQIQQLDRAISREEQRVRQTLQQTYEAARQREQQLQTAVNELKSGLLDLRRRSVQYNIFERDVDTNRQLYDALLQRYKEIGVAGGVGVNNISIVDQAELPKRPSSPRLLLNIAIALLAGLGIGAVAAFMLEQIDQGITDPGEVEKSLGLPLLGTVPRITDGTPLSALADRKSMLTESYMSVQTNLAFSTDHGVPKTLAITSTRPAEGKTTTSYALASAIAKVGRRVVLLDADMRSPSLHYLIDDTNSIGLSNYLSGDDDLSRSLKPTQNESMFVMTAGPQPPSAPELLSSERFGRLMDQLLQRFDHVVIDAPPVMGLADSPLIGNKVEGVVFVVESHGTHRSMAQVAVRRLLAANATILGTVLTKFDSKRAHYGYGYEYGYGYGYGDSAQENR